MQRFRDNVPGPGTYFAYSKKQPVPKLQALQSITESGFLRLNKKVSCS